MKREKSKLKKDKTINICSYSILDFINAQIYFMQRAITFHKNKKTKQKQNSVKIYVYWFTADLFIQILFKTS